VRFTQI